MDLVIGSTSATSGRALPLLSRNGLQVTKRLSAPPVFIAILSESDLLHSGWSLYSAFQQYKPNVSLTSSQQTHARRIVLVKAVQVALRFILLHFLHSNTPCPILCGRDFGLRVLILAQAIKITVAVPTKDQSSRMVAATTAFEQFWTLLTRH